MSLLERQMGAEPQATGLTDSDSYGGGAAPKYITHRRQCPEVTSAPGSPAFSSPSPSDRYPGGPSDNAHHLVAIRCLCVHVYVCVHVGVCARVCATIPRCC